MNVHCSWELEKKKKNFFILHPIKILFFFQLCLSLSSHSQLPLNFPIPLSTRSELSPLCLTAVGLNVIGPPLTHSAGVPSRRFMPPPSPPSHRSPNADNPGLLWISWVSSSIQALGFSGFHRQSRHCLPQPIALVFCRSQVSLYSFSFFLFSFFKFFL